MKTKFILNTLILTVLTFVFIATAPAFAEDDDHYIDSEHYFISKEAFKQGWIYVSLANLKTAATVQTKNEAEFISVRDGEEIWTKFYYKTRFAAKEELKIGLQIIACEIGDGEVNRAPANKDEAIGNNWFMAKITDVSDMFKGYVTVSGGYKINLDNMRVVVKEKTK